MKYPKAFEKYWGWTYEDRLAHDPKHIAYKAWKAGRRHEKAQHKELDAW